MLLICMYCLKFQIARLGRKNKYGILKTDHMSTITIIVIFIIMCIIVITIIITKLLEEEGDDLMSKVNFHNFKSRYFKLSVSDPSSKYVAYLYVLSQISNCQTRPQKQICIFEN